MKVSLFFHNYYGGHEEWIRFFCEKMAVPFVLFYNVVEDSLYNLEGGEPAGDFPAGGASAAAIPPRGALAGGADPLLDRLRNAASGPGLQDIVLRRSPNQGKDIGGKLVLLDACLRLGMESDLFIFLHDKKSPYKVQNRQWQEKLFAIIDPSFAGKALDAFSKQKDLGILTGSGSIQDEYDYSRQSFASHNRSLLGRLQEEYGITPPRYHFAAGTMFWARSLPLMTFLSRHAPLDIRRTLETGNVLDEQQGTMTHSWERLLSWLIIAQGFDIKGF